MLALPASVAGYDRKLHVDGRVFAVLIFDFGLRERGLRAGAPKDRLLRFVDQPFLDEDGERAQNLRFVCGIQRQIWMLPIAQDAEPFELLALDVDELARECLRFLAHFQRRKPARFLHHLVFDRQSVAIPARHIRRAKAGHRFRFHHQILEDFVERRAHVHIAVGKRRAVVQHEQPAPRHAPFGFVRKARVSSHTFEHLRLARGEICLHRKIRLRQIQRVFVVLAHRGRATLPSAFGQRNAPANAVRILT